ncbi:MAG: 2-C-methyl-D-erythritol 4-phosphate cytidylyltransferase [Leadbetterella sp.]|nr:2-C-methyl-D-erythritol 4-phosphate cytidylyltransferase [Leadbetterella sp.]
MTRKIAIIVASGTGSRMGGDIPKQFLPLKGRPVLVHTLEKFLAISGCEIILALSAEGLAYWEPIAREYLPADAPITLVTGGETRFHSVKNALAAIDAGDALVAIHDGVRPFVSLNILLNAFVAAESFGAAVACVDSKDSVRVTEGAGNRAVDRRTVKLIQTPQTFRLSVLRTAFEVPYSEHFTDDASVVEHSGQAIHLIEGSYSNIKITTPEDLALGEIFLGQTAF